MKTHTVDYNDIKTAIYKSASIADENQAGVDFVIDKAKLDSFVSASGLITVNTGLESRRLNPNDIPYLSEYFNEKALPWITDNKDVTTLVFVVNDPEDAALQNLLTIMNTPEAELDPSVDKVNVLAQIVSTYCCYFAVVVSYKSDNPDSYGRITYSIKCRANKITIKQENYKYNPADMS